MTWLAETVLLVLIVAFAAIAIVVGCQYVTAGGC